jgi:hypothetical protein
VLRVYRRRYGHWVCRRRVGFVGEGSIVANRGVGSVTEEWWVSNEIWPWKLGVGEEASSPVRGDLVGDGGVGRVGSWRQGFGLGRNQIHWPHQKFIHVSTNEVYGETDEDVVVGNHEASQLLPTNPYSTTKAGAEMLVMAYGRSYGLPVSTMRGNNVYAWTQLVS